MFIVISKPNCVNCNVAKNILKRKEQPYSEVNIMAPTAEQQPIIEAFYSLGVKSLPLVFHYKEDGETVAVGDHTAVQEYVNELLKPVAESPER